MEETVKKEQLSKKRANWGVIIVSILLVLVAVGFFVSFFGFMSTYAVTAGAAPSLSVYLSNLFLIGGFALVSMVLFVISIFFAIEIRRPMSKIWIWGFLVEAAIKGRRELMSKIWMWGVLILAAMYSTTFFTSLAQAGAAINFYASYIPWVVLLIASVTMIAGWDSSNKKRVNIIEWVCLAASVAMSVIFFAATLGSLMSTEALAIYYILITLTVNAALNLFILLLALITRSKRTFDKVIFAMSDEEADIVERIEARVDEIADEVEEMAAEGEAFVEAKAAAEIMEEEAAQAEEKAAEEEVVIETEVVAEETVEDKPEEEK